MARSVITPERFASGRTFDDYVKYAGSAENLAREAWGGYFSDGGSKAVARKDNSGVFRERYARARLTDYQTAAIKWIAAQPGGPAQILAISEDWSSESRRVSRRQSRPHARVHERQERRRMGVAAGHRVLHPRLQGAAPLPRISRDL